MGIIQKLGLDDKEKVSEAVSDFGKNIFDVKRKLKTFLEGKGIFEYNVSEVVLTEVSQYKVIHAILFGAEVSRNVYQNTNSSRIDKEEIMGWIPEIDEDSENLPRNHAQAVREILDFYFQNN